mgnify:CR=1 FL=1
MTKLISMVAAFAPQAGKSTFVGNFAEIVSASDINRVGVLSFANSMKWMLISFLQQSCGYTEEEAILALFGKAKEEALRIGGINQPVTHRKMMQTLGTEWRLALGLENLWADIVAKQIKGLSAEPLTFMIDDWRFLNEYQVVKNLEKEGFKVITVCIRNANAEANYNGTHASEGELKDFDFDFTFHNNGSLDEFKAQATEFAKELESMLCP